MSRLVFTRFLALNRASQFRPVLNTVNQSRLLASWGPDKLPVDRKEVELRVFKSIATHDKVDQSQVKIETHLFNDLGLDSLDQVEVIMAVEDEFDIEIDDVNSEKLFTVKDIIEFVIKYIDGKKDPMQNPGPKFNPNMDFGKG